MGPILLVCATPQECAPLLPPAASAKKIGGRAVYELGPQAAALVGGVGKTNTAQAVTALLERAEFAAVVNFGSAGAFLSSGLSPGDLAVASEEVSDELVVLPGRLATLAEIGLPLVATEPPLYGRFPVAEGLTGRVLAACRRSLFPGQELASGPFLTVSRLTCSRAEAGRLQALLGPLLCESMEGAAAAQVAHHYGLPFAEVRAVANLIDDRQRQAWDFGLAARNCGRAVRDLLADLAAKPL